MSKFKILGLCFGLLVSGCADQHSKSEEKIEQFVYSKDPVNYEYSQLQEIPFQQVQIRDSFWSPKIKTIADTTLNLVWKMAEDQGRFENFKIVAGKSDSTYALRNSPDAPLYKIIEAAAYTLSEKSNDKLEKAIDQFIDLAGSIQQEDGYLHTQFMLNDSDELAPKQKKAIKTFGFGKDQQWQSTYSNWPTGYSQLFTAGHMFEAAVAYYRATGKRELLDISKKFANLIVKKFQDTSFARKYADHPEVEIGLMKMYEVTGDMKYVNTANLISRYVKFGRPPDIHLEESLLPLHEQQHAFGHAVRTAYVYTGATDVVRALGYDDLNASLHALWTSVAERKMYIHGGTGNGTEAEQHGSDYELPIYPTYSEGCANVAMGQWNQSLNLLTGNAKYADIVELEMYNAALSGISIDGTKFFYSNKLNVDLEDRKGKHGGVRETYFFCCPSKLPGFVSGISRWLYAADKNGIYINQYVQSEVQTKFDEQDVKLSVETNYPYEGSIKIRMDEVPENDFNVNLRIPSWVRGREIFEGSLYYYKDSLDNTFTIRINDQKIEPVTLDKGYITLNRHWKKGDKIELLLEMPVRRVYTDSKNKYNNGRVALMRGPLLDALEGVDNNFDVSKFILPPDEKITPAIDKSLLGGTVILEGVGKVGVKRVIFKAIPYHLWQNRGISKMTTLLIEDPNELYDQTTSLKTKVNTQG